MQKKTMIYTLYFLQNVDRMEIYRYGKYMKNKMANITNKW